MQKSAATKGLDRKEKQRERETGSKTQKCQLEWE